MARALPGKEAGRKQPEALPLQSQAATHKMHKITFKIHRRFARQAEPVSACRTTRSTFDSQMLLTADRSAEHSYFITPPAASKYLKQMTFLLFS